MKELERVKEVQEDGLLQDGVHNENPYRASFIRLLRKYQEDEELMTLSLEFASRLNTRRNEASRATRQE